VRIRLFLPHLGVTGGLGVHCRATVAALLAADPDCQLTVFAPADPGGLFPLAGRDDTHPALLTHPRVRFVPLDWPPGANLADPVDAVLAGPLAAHPGDVLLCSYYVGLEKPPCPQAVVFHDAGFLEFPQVFGATAERRRAGVARTRLDRLVAVSADGRDRVCRLLPFDPARTTVVWHALTDPPEELAAARTFAGELWPGGDTLADWGRYVFSPVGAATGFNRVRKNVPAGVRAFRRLSRPGLTLVIASTGTLTDRMLADLLPAGETGSVVRGAWRSGDGAVVVLPNLDRRPFLAAMGHAAAVLYPTRYEGFGLPAIEAMALGVPLVAGAATSLPEVVGDAGRLVPPDDEAGFAAALRDVLDDSAVAADLVRRGTERVRLFTPERMGRELVGVLAALAGGGSAAG
jgi:glycosyltransferase involved in cell wall biosynthesis